MPCKRYKLKRYGSCRVRYMVLAGMVDSDVSF